MRVIRKSMTDGTQQRTSCPSIKLGAQFPPQRREGAQSYMVSCTSMFPVRNRRRSPKDKEVFRPGTERIEPGRAPFVHHASISGRQRKKIAWR